MPYPIIDVRLGVERVCGNVELWREGVAKLIKELPGAMTDIEGALAEQRLEDLKFKVHYLLGTALYCGMPMLEASLKAVRYAYTDAPEELELQVVSLKIAVDAVVVFVQTHGIPEV